MKRGTLRIIDLKKLMARDNRSAVFRRAYKYERHLCTLMLRGWFHDKR